jgi:hypothetical protein
MRNDLVRLQQNIARLRRDIRLQAREMQALIDSDIDCTSAARLLMRMQADLVLFIEKRQRLKSPHAPVNDEQVALKILSLRGEIAELGSAIRQLQKRME